jgi:hypothetical protein
MDMSQLLRALGLQQAYQAYQQNIGQPFANVAGPFGRGLLGLDRPEYGEEQAYRTGQAVGNMPAVSAPVGAFKAVMQAPEAIGAIASITPKAARKIVDALTNQQLANEVARQNAVKMLGLPETNTAMDRAKAMGFERGWYHGTTGDIKQFSPEFLGETTGASSAKKAYFMASDPVNPPEHMRVKSPNTSESVELLRKLGIPESEIAKLNQVSMVGHGAETASGYARLGGSREYKEAMRKANSAEKSGNWLEYEKWMKIAEDSEIKRSNELQSLVAKYGDARDTLEDKIFNWYNDVNLPPQQIKELGEKIKQLMPYGWYNSYSVPQMQSLRTEVSKLPNVSSDLLKSLDDFIAIKAERQLAEGTQQGANVLPLMIRSENPMTHDFGGLSYRDQTYSDLVDQAIRNKNDVLFLRNTFDPGGGAAKLIDVAAVMNPSQIRSSFAAFDPARINENNLLATLAAMGIGVPIAAGLLGDQTE